MGIGSYQFPDLQHGGIYNLDETIVSKHSRASHGNCANSVSAAESRSGRHPGGSPGGYATSSFDNMNFDRDHLSEGISHPPCRLKVAKVYLHTYALF